MGFIIYVEKIKLIFNNRNQSLVARGQVELTVKGHKELWGVIQMFHTLLLVCYMGKHICQVFKLYVQNDCNKTDFFNE